MWGGVARTAACPYLSTPAEQQLCLRSRSQSPAWRELILPWSPSVQVKIMDGICRFQRNRLEWTENRSIEVCQAHDIPTGWWQKLMNCNGLFVPGFWPTSQPAPVSRFFHRMFHCCPPELFSDQRDPTARRWYAKHFFSNKAAHSIETTGVIRTRH